MDRWSKPTKCWCGWLGNWVKIRRQTGLSIYQNWCMLTTPWDLAITGYNLHYLMFGWWLHLSIWLLFSHYCEHRNNNSMSITTLLTYVSDCMKLSRKCKCSPHLEGERQRQYYNCKGKCHFIGTRWPGLGAKADMPSKGRRKVKDWWEEEPYEVEFRIAEGIPSYLMKNQWTGCSWVIHQNSTSSHYPHNGSSFMFRCMSWADKMHHHHPGVTYLGSEVRMRKCHKV